MACPLWLYRLLPFLRWWSNAPLQTFKGEAIQAIYPQLDSEICRICSTRIFRECHIALPDGTPRDAADKGQ